MNELLKQISENPELIEAYTAEEIAVAREALTEFTVAVKAGEIPADEAAIAEAVALAGKLTEREGVLAESEAARLAEIAKLDEALGLTTEEVEEIVAEESGPEDEDEEEDEEAKVDVVVAAAPPTLGQISQLVPKASKPEPAGDVLTASAGVRMGQSIGGLEFAQIAIDAYRSSPGKHVVAQAESKHKYSLRKGDDEGNARVLAMVARDAAQDVLLASGGRCAPPENVYSFFNIAERTGILNLPTVNAPRGAINLPVSPSLGDILGQSGIATEWTNANDESETPSPATKPAYVFECPEFDECEVSAWPTILQFGNFTARFFPEAVAHVTSLAVVAADRTLNAARLAFMVGAGVAGNVVDTTGGGLIDLAVNLASNANDYRATYGMSRDSVLDVAAPAWLPDALFADAIARDSTVDYGTITGKVSAIFSQLRLRPQFVYDLDDQTDGNFENEAQILMWAPGTVVELDGGTLDLGVVRDSTLNASNNYQTFVEPFVGWCVPGHEIRRFVIQSCPTGATGDRVTIACSTDS